MSLSGASWMAVESDKGRITFLGEQGFMVGYLFHKVVLGWTLCELCYVTFIKN